MTRGENKFNRPALASFWRELRKKLEFASDFENISFEEYPEAWNEWKMQLNGIQDNNNNKLEFLKLLQLKTESKNLDEIKKRYYKPII